MLQMELCENPDLQECTSLIIRASERINRIIVELLDLYAPRRNSLEQVNINKLLNEMISLQRHSGRARHIDFKLILDPGIPPIYGDSGLLSPLFLDGVAKTHQLLRCYDYFAASTYASTPHCSIIARLAFGAFCLAIIFDTFCEGIFLNLLKNAWEASFEHTEIIIETRIDGEYYLSVEGSRPTP